MKARKYNLIEGPILRSLLTLGIPMVIANTLQSAYQLTDALWVGRLGEDALAAVSVSFPVTFLAIAMAAGFTVAGTTLVAQYTGAKNKKMVNHVSAQTMLMVVVVSIVISLFGFFLTPLLLTWMGVEARVFEHAIGFMRMSFVGLVFVFGYSAVQALLRGIGEVKLPMFIVLGTVLLNLIADPLFIYGWGPIPAMGVMGAALATLLTQSIAMFVGVIVLLGGNFDIHVKFKDFIPDMKFIKRTFILGLPSSIEMSSRGLGMIAMTFLVAAFGTTSIAAYGIGSNILMLVIIPALGLAMATSTLVGQCIGAQKLDRAADVIKLSALAGFGILTAIGGCVFLGASTLATMFVPGEPEVIVAATTFIQIMAWSYGAIGVQMCLIGVFQAAGKMTTAMALTLVSQFVFQIPTAWLLSSFTPLKELGIWWAIPITNAAMLLVTVLWFLRGDWKGGNLTEEEELQGKVLQGAPE